MNDNDVLASGWALRGKRLYGMRKGWKTQRISTIAFSTQTQFVASMVFEGYCNNVVVIEFFKNVLLPQLSKGMVLVIDRASYHMNFYLEQLVTTAGCTLIYLPAYSPDYNPIEKLWAPFKHTTRKIMTTGKNLMDSMISSLNHYSQPN